MAAILDFDRWRSEVDQDAENENPMSRTGASNSRSINTAPPVSKAGQENTVLMTSELEGTLLKEISDAEDLLFARILEFWQAEKMTSLSDEDKKEVIENLDRDYLRSIVLHEMEHVMHARGSGQIQAPKSSEFHLSQTTSSENMAASTAKFAPTDSSQPDKAPAVSSTTLPATSPEVAVRKAKRTPARHLAASGTLELAMSRLWPTLSAARDT